MFKKNQKGSLKWIILIIIALVLASYFFDFNLQEAVEDEQTQSNFGYIIGYLTDFYNAYIRDTFDILYNFFMENIWPNFIDNIQNGSIENIDTKALMETS